MINSISHSVARWLQKQRVIARGDIELYSYAVYSIIFGSLPLIITMFWGILFNMVIEGLMMILPFLLIRKFSGGKHLQSSILCFIVSAMVILCVFMIMEYALGHTTVDFISPATVIAAIILFVFSPIDSSSRKLSQKETALFRKIARYMAIGILTLFLLLRFLCPARYYIPLGMGEILAASLQVPCIYRIVQKKYWNGREQ